jgi:hypothetical protein
MTQPTPDHNERSACLQHHFRLLREGIESTGDWDAEGPRLVAQRAGGSKVTFQIYGVDGRAAPGGICAWSLRRDPSNALVALVDVGKERIWLLRGHEVNQYSKPSRDGTRRIYTYAEPTLDPEKTGHIVFSGEFDECLIEKRLRSLL